MSRLMLSRRLVHAGGKVLVATSAAPTSGHDDTFVRPGEIVYLRAGLFVIDNRPHRDLQDNALAVAPSAIGAFPVPAALAFVFRIEAEVDQRVMALTGFHNDVAARAAVATGRAAPRDKLLPPEGHTSVAAVPRFDLDDCFVNEH